MESSKKPQIFYASFTGTSRAKPHDIWAIWTDVNGWINWDDGLESSCLQGIFAVGNKFSITPSNGESIDVELKTVVQGETFSDECLVPFGVIRGEHRLEEFGNFTKITHAMEVTVNTDFTDAFLKEIWPQMQRGLTQSVMNIIDILE